VLNFTSNVYRCDQNLILKIRKMLLRKERKKRENLDRGEWRYGGPRRK